MSKTDVLDIPGGMISTEPTSSGPILPPSTVVKIVVEGQTFEIANTLAASFAIGKLRRVEDGSYTFPREWDVRSPQFSLLIDLLCSTK